jgi:hypothetical protein
MKHIEHPLASLEALSRRRTSYSHWGLAKVIHCEVQRLKTLSSPYFFGSPGNRDQNIDVRRCVEMFFTDKEPK